MTHAGEGRRGPAGPVMERCPTCGATYRGGETCGRCQTDLRQLLALEAAAARHRRQAMEALHTARPRAAQAHARAACRAQRSGESIRVAALTSLACGDFAAAAALWRELGAQAPPGGR